MPLGHIATALFPRRALSRERPSTLGADGGSCHALLALACVALAYACGGETTEPPPPDPTRPTTVSVSPATSELTALGATVQLSAEVRDQGGRAMSGATLTWESDSAAVATVSASGLVTAAGDGTATITATAGRVSGNAAVTVAQQVSAVEVTPGAGFVLPGTSLQLAAEARDANGHAVPGSRFAWASSDTTVAVVDTLGLVLGIGLGAVEVSATSSGATGRAQLDVVEPEATTVAVSPDAIAFDALGDTLRLVAQVQDQAGRPLPGASVTWSASDTLVATVDASGLVSAVTNGAASITAASGALSDHAAVEVLQVARTVILSPGADTLILGDSLRLAAEALDGNGHPVVGAAFTWSSSKAAIATADTSGVVRGVGEGTAEIAAETGNVREVARITVFSPDRAPLVAFYGATSGPEWLRNDNWLTDKPLAQWHGVHADGSGRVQNVILSGNGLKGTIPREFGDLASLEHLDLSHNELAGPIPPQLGGLARLRILLFHDNSLEGALPPELGKLARLEHLSVYGNDLTGPIPPEFGMLGNLNHLILHENGLSGPIPPELGNLTQLRDLLLHGNELAGPIPPELGNLVKLRVLELSYNSLEGALPPELGKLARLEILSIHESALSGAIPPELGELAALKRLFLGANELTGSIPSELGSLASLEHLHLFGNDLTGPIPPEFGMLGNLNHLILHENGFSGPIPPELGNLTQLRDLVLHGNELAGPIPRALGNLEGLTVLDLRDNALTGPIPAELGDLRALTRLDLGGNALTGPVPIRLGQLTALDALLLENNALEGPVPADLSALTMLRSLNLTNNEGMRGILPAGLTALTRMEVFLAGGTGLCVPSEVNYETWLRGIHRQRIRRCPDASPSTAYLVQAVQSREFPVPLVAGEDALLRVFVTARQASGEHIPPVRARFFVNDREIHVEGIARGESPIPTGMDESRLGGSANAVIPGRVIRSGLEMVIEVDPGGTLDPDLGVASRIPETGRLRVEVHDMPSLDLTFVPFLWAANPDSSILELVDEMAADPANHELLHRTRTLLPLAELDVTAHEPVLTSTNHALGLLAETRIIRTMEGGTGHYMGTMAGPIAGPAAGLAYQPGRVAFAVPHERAVSHELGHNLSIAHTPCGGLSNIDPLYPHAGGVIGAWGYDFREARLVSPSTLDLMGCGPPNWVSDYHFDNALRFRLSDESPPVSADRPGEDGTLLLWGGADPSGKPFLEPAFVVDAPALLPDAGGDYRIAGRTADGAELFSMSFAMPDVADGDGSSSFVFAVPVQSSWARTLAGIVLSGPGGVAALDDDTDRTVAIVRNPRSGQVRGILRDVPVEVGRGLAAMGAAGGEAVFEVLLSRGIPDAAAWRERR